MGCAKCRTRMRNLGLDASKIFFIYWCPQCEWSLKVIYLAA